jgi:cobalamin biosynthesis protein CbiG
MSTVPAAAVAVAVGVGLSSAATGAEVAALVDACLALAAVEPADVACVATIDRHAADDRLLALGFPVIGFPADALAGVAGVEDGTDRDGRVAAAVGTPSVAEAAALLAVGAGAELVVRKQRSAHATGAVGRRRSS